MHIWVFSWAEGCPQQGLVPVPTCSLGSWRNARVFPTSGPFHGLLSLLGSLLLPHLQVPLQCHLLRESFPDPLCGCSTPPRSLSVSARSPRAHLRKLLSPIRMSLPITVRVPQAQGLVLKPPWAGAGAGAHPDALQWAACPCSAPVGAGAKSHLHAWEMPISAESLDMPGLSGHDQS